MSTATAGVQIKTASRRISGDQIFRAIIIGIVWCVLMIFARSIFAVLVVGAWPAMKKFGVGFIFSTGWDPVHLVFGAFPFIVGTVIVALGGMTWPEASDC